MELNFLDGRKFNTRPQTYIIIITSNSNSKNKSGILRWQKLKNSCRNMLSTYQDV